MPRLAFFTAAVLALSSLATGALPPPSRRHGTLALPPLSRIAANFTTVGAFQQLLSHDERDLGTFPQQFWASDRYVRNKTSFPVVLMLPGEQPGVGNDSLLSDDFLYGAIAKEIGAAMVVLEHRYYGGSSPFDTLTAENLRHLTLHNAITDLVHFARTVTLPFDPEDRNRAPHTPWIVVGCSYAGALSSWTATTAPGTFWAHYAASAPVEAIEDFWRYFEPVRSGMPCNCSHDVALVISHVNSVLAHADLRTKEALKDQFGLSLLKHDDDFASALQLPLWEWQNNGFTSGYSKFFEFCDYVENVQTGSNHHEVPDGKGVGSRRALTGFAKWMREAYLPGCTYSLTFPYKAQRQSSSSSARVCEVDEDHQQPLWIDYIMNAWRPLASTEV